VFKSTNGGASWTAINSGLTGLGSNYVKALGIDPVTPTTLYAGTDGGGVFGSIDGGASWTAINSGLTNNWVNALAIDALSPNNVYLGTNGGVFKSRTGGWSSINDAGIVDAAVHALAIDRVARPQSMRARTAVVCLCSSEVEKNRRVKWQGRAACWAQTHTRQ